MSVLEVKNLNLKINGKKILSNLNLEINKGQVHAIVGPNGAGKSTFASAVMGLTEYRDISGKILFKGEEIQNMTIDARAQRGMSFAWQEPARYEGLKVRDFLLAGSRQKDEDYIADKLEKMGLDSQAYLQRAVDETLSGGERKKVELASIMAMDPEMIMLDEPDSGIDVGTLEKIFEIIKDLKQKGTTVVLITHSIAVLKQAEHAFLMCHGEIIDRGSAEKIIPYFEEKCIPCPHKNLPEEGDISHE
ncbi:MAG: ABC transporter ATP-binding protein [Candidatus Cloacimonetes bacterium]|nr:ABC transporter ATP-binding protein [Candidatus Cloacimonadota bacterium]